MKNRLSEVFSSKFPPVLLDIPPGIISHGHDNALNNKAISLKTILKHLAERWESHLEANLPWIIRRYNQDDD